MALFPKHPKKSPNSDGSQRSLPKKSALNRSLGPTLAESADRAGVMMAVFLR